ncbi:MAG TPA: ComEC/Rec2 family competence protein [Candidatus Saccharimonadales bacterium]|nr:ComEC/Rec2 family competence protein [Candidatus Saccharimonadales bacterium]
MKTTTHASWQIAAMSWGVICGAALSCFVNVEINLLIVVIGILGCIVCVAFRFVLLLPLAFAGGLLLGMAVNNFQSNQIEKYQPIYGKQVLVTGIVSEDVSKNEKDEQQIKLTQVSAAGQNLSGVIWLSTRDGNLIKRGDFIAAQGKLDHGFGNIPASIFKAKIIKVEQPVPGDLARIARDWFADAVRIAIPSPQVDLGLGYLLGQQNELPHDLNEKLKLLGLTHVVVASGYNLTILVRFARKSFLNISKRLSVLVTSAMIIGFVLMTGFSPSMSRAAIVTGLCLAAWYYGRNIHPLVLLPFVAATTLLLNPGSINGDLGWYLSFGSFAGVIILAPLVNSFFWRNKDPGILREIFVGTLCAQIVTLPIILLYFGQYSPLALFANVMILPLIPPAMLFIFLAGISGILVPNFAEILGLPAFWILKYMTSIVDWIASIPFAKGEVHFNVLSLIFSYTVIVILTLFLWRATKFNFYKSSVLE